MHEYREDIPYEIVSPRSTSEQREGYWEVGSSLQETDDLSTSDYANEAARGYIAGDMAANDLQDDLLRHYESLTARDAGRQREADVVAARIAGLLELASFSCRPSTLIGIHAALFHGVLQPKWVGRIRTEEISKAEPILGGRSVEHSPVALIAAALDYDFERENGRPYEYPVDADQLDRFTRFIAGIWQIHPFREGNTRTIATFSLLYLRKLGIEIDNGPFRRNSTLYRDMLARASFSSIELGVREDYGPLMEFYENVAMGAGHDLDRLDLNIHGIRSKSSDEVGYREPIPFDPGAGMDSVPAPDDQESLSMISGRLTERRESDDEG